MRRHIILALGRMPIQIALLIIRHNPFHSITHVLPNVAIPILIHTQRARGMLHEQMQDADFVVLDLGELFDNVIGYEVGAARFGREADSFLEPRHAGGCGCVAGGSWRGAEEGEEGEAEERVEEAGEECEDEDYEEEEGRSDA